MAHVYVYVHLTAKPQQPRVLTQPSLVINSVSPLSQNMGSLYTFQEQREVTLSSQ